MIKSIDELDIYQVGGSVRDEIMGIPPHDIDYVVVGTSIEEMINLGFKPVGQDFPVFLHPITHEQYALARSEKKTGVGYKGFTFHTSPEVSLLEDLKRRDLTINAIAKDKQGNYIDPFNGCLDIQKGILRHVSTAFLEDPLRVLRVARFSARFNFIVAETTINLMNKIVSSQELLTLSKERIWQETHKALMTNNIDIYFNILNDISALDQILTEFKPLVTNKQINDKLKSLNEQMCINNLDLSVRFALICYLLNEAQIKTENVIKNSYINNSSRELALLLSKNYSQVHKLNQLSYEEIYNLIKLIDPTRKKSRYKSFIKLVYLIASKFNDTLTINNLNTLKKIISEISTLNISKIVEENNTDFISKIKLLKYKIIADNIYSLSES